MRFLHLADLHIGKMFNDVSMLEDQRSVLMDQIIETAKERDVEAGTDSGRRLSALDAAGGRYGAFQPVCVGACRDG